MTKFIVCKISDEDFGGFNIGVDISHYHSLDDIANYVKCMLIKSLERLSLLTLATKVRNKRLHIHHKKFSELEQMGENEILYVCGHC